MAGVVVYLNGGPCDGTNKNLTQKQFNSHKTKCGGSTYTYDPTLTANFELPVFSTSADTGKAAGGASSLKAPQALKGWQALRKSVNKSMPSALRSSRKASTSALRSLSRARKVRL